MNLFKYFVSIAFFALYGMISFTSCVKEEKYNTDSSFKLKFSTDTLTFDTVFTTISSAVKEIRVYNNGSESIKISRVYIQNGQSRYRITVDGIVSNSVTDVEIKPKDSLSIFVRVNVNPNDETMPFILLDSIMFNINGNTQKVMLSAYGQNAYYHVPDYSSDRKLAYEDRKGRIRYIYYSLANEGGEKSGVIVNGNTIQWKTDKPHVIVGYCVVDSSYTLEIGAGTSIYMGDKSVLWAYKDATLKISGTNTSHVVFQGSRLESYYKDIPGQWDRIWLSSGSKDNVIDNVEIRNATIGLHVDTCVNSNPTLKLSNAIIENISTYGIVAQGAYIEAENIVIGKCGMHAIDLAIGGNYNFKHVTIGNYWNESTRKTPSIVISNWYKDTSGNIHVRDLTQAYFGNCIIYGNIETELSLSGRSGGAFNYSFRNCLIKYPQSLDMQGFENCEYLRNKDPKFEDAQHNKLKLQAGSPALGQGNSDDGLAVPFDIENQARAFNPTLGAYETIVDKNMKR